MTASCIESLSVTASCIESLSVTASCIESPSVTASCIESLSVTASCIESLSVTASCSSHFLIEVCGHFQYIAISTRYQNSHIYHFVDFLVQEYAFLFWSARSTPPMFILYITSRKMDKVHLFDSHQSFFVQQL